ncbi:mechanosensitive ion channel [Candidatus Woesearchaeota archaeon]|nr:mechanosensitive ion channel [Candidatus Woesearchaeota archaeon]
MKWLDFFNSITTNIAVIVLIILVGFIIARLVGKLVYRILHEFEVDSLLNRKTGSVEESISQVLEYVIYIITVCIAVDTLGILAYVLIVLIVAFALIIILSIISGARDFIPNFLCSWWVRKNHAINTYIDLDDVKGRIIKRGLLRIKIKTRSRDIISVPNFTVLKKKWK